MDKHRVSEILEEIAVLLELKGENPFRTRAYHNAARVVEGIAEPLEDLIDQRRLTEIKGIGEGLAEKIQEMVATGRCHYHEELKASFPKEFIEILRIPGLGPKRAKFLFDKLKIKNTRELEKACRENKVAGLEGFGERSQRKILEGINFLQNTQAYHLYDQALREAEDILARLRQRKEVIRSDFCGSLRRCKEVIGDVDILVSAKKSAQIMSLFVESPSVETVTAHGETKSSVVLKSGIASDLRVVSDEEFPFALLYFTGSKEHNTSLRARAIKYGYKLNEYGIFKGEKRISCKNEAEIFKLLELQYIPPELRENQGEIEAAEKRKIPTLVEPDEIRGTFHVHSDYTDGAATLEAMIAAAERAGFEYVGIADHSQAAYYANGMKPATVKKQHAEIDRLQKKFPKIKIFKGIECDILKDGSMDYPDSILASFDFVIGSVHSHFTLPEADQTARVIRALSNPHVTMLGHPTGRLLLAREGYAINLPKVIDAAAKYQKVIEINANPHRFDLDWRFIKLAKEKGVKLAINPDAHSLEGILDTRFGVGIARKGWCTRDDVVNTLTAKEVEKMLGQKK